MHEILIPNARRYYTSELNLIQQVFLLKNYVISAIIRLIHLSPKQTLSHIFLLTMNAIKEAHYNLGIAYLEAGQYSKAIPEFEASIKLDSNFIEAHCALCRAYLEQDELEKAGISVTQALKLDSTHQPTLLLHGTIVEAYHDRGKAYLDDKYYTEAVATLQKAINLDADLGDNSQTAPYEKTYIYAHLGAAYIGMKAYQNAIDALENAIALDPDLVDAHYHLGHAYVEQGHADKAIPHLERTIAIAPHLKRAHYNLARAYQESGNLEAATHAVTETLRLDPNYQRAHELADTIKQAHYNKGITHLNNERYSEAVTAFQNAITLDSDFTTAHYNLGLAHYEMEMYPRAVDALQKAIVLDPTYTAAHHSLALAYLGQQELAKAKDAARDALKLDPNHQPARSLLEAIDPSFTPPKTQLVTPPEPDQSVAPPETKSRQEIHHELGVTYQNVKMHPEAISEFQKAIDLNPDFVVAHLSLGKSYFEMGQLDEAENAAKAVLRIDTNSQPARQLLEDIREVRPPEQTQPTEISPDTSDANAKKYYEQGEAFLNNRQYNEAAAVFKRAIKADPNFGDAHYSLGVTYLEMGLLDEAKMAAEEASRLKVNPQLVHELYTAIKFVETHTRRENRWKKGLSYVVILVVAAVLAFLFWPKPPSVLDPDLSIAASLEEPSGNGFLDADESGRIRVLITNKGGTVRNVEVRFEPSSIEGLQLRKPTRIPTLSENTVETIRIPVTASRNIIGRNQSLQLQLFGENRTLLVAKDFTFKIIPVTPAPERPRPRWRD